MASARPLVAVRSLDKDAKTVSVPTPAVFTAPIRPDIVHFVHTNMNKNKRQAYGVNDMSGMQHSAESWGTGRAVARIPRVSGGGTSRSGQAAFGNMCRKGRMFAPTKVWRKWHRKINNNQRRYAVVSALAASALPSLVMARGHRVENVPEIPLVVDNSIESIEKTKAAVAALQAFGAYEDVEKAAASRKLRCGVGKSRNRRHVQRRGPLVVFANDQGLTRAFRNLPGVETASVDSLNLLQLAPGGHLGRFIVWTRGAFEKLHSIYGSVNRESAVKSGFKLPRSVMHNSDLTRIINSDEIQSKLRPSIKTVHRFRQHKNPLKNLGVMVRLNPYAATARRSEILAQQRRAEAKNAVLAKTKAQADAIQAAKDRTHEPQQRLNFKRLFADDFKAPEEFKLVIQKPRAPITPPAALTADQKAKKVAARKASAKAVKPAKAVAAAEKAPLTGAQEMLATLMKGQTAITKTKAKKSGGGAKGGKGAAKKGDAKKGDAKAAAPKKK